MEAMNAYAIPGLPPAKRRQITIETIIAATCDYFNVDERKVKSKGRHRVNLKPRQIAMYLIRELTDVPLKRIALRFSGRDHTTAIHAIQVVRNYLQVYPEYREYVSDIKRSLGVYD